MLVLALKIREKFGIDYTTVSALFLFFLLGWPRLGMHSLMRFLESELWFSSRVWFITFLAFLLSARYTVYVLGL